MPLIVFRRPQRVVSLHQLTRTAEQRLPLPHLTRVGYRSGAGDHTQDFTGRRLLLQRFLEFLEQTDILDGDHRLVSEGF